MEIYNRKARFNYFIEDELECGIALVGTEVKSIRDGSANINDSFARIKNNEIFLINMFISKYKEGNIFNHSETRERKLLLHRSEINKLSKKVELNNYTLVPLKLYFLRGKAKILLGLCKGKKLYDKRQTIKERDLKRKENIN